jgi:L-ribulose-5-phosphate 4-epimerase
MATDTATAEKDGVLKFSVSRQQAAPANPRWMELDATRKLLWQQGLIGHDPALNVGYGNISLRLPGGHFLISASQTGHKAQLLAEDYVEVDGWDFASNSVTCRGTGLPSSEALSHAALYNHPGVAAVIHVHHRVLWQQLIIAGVMSTAADIPYGSEALYRAFLSLVAGGPAACQLPLLLVTKGHESGIFVAAASLQAAHQILLEHCRRNGIVLSHIS